MFMQVRSNRHAFCFVAPASQPLNKPVPPPPSAQPAAVQQVRPASGLAASSTQVSACMFFGVCVLLKYPGERLHVLWGVRARFPGHA